VVATVKATVASKVRKYTTSYKGVKWLNKAMYSCFKCRFDSCHVH